MAYNDLYRLSSHAVITDQNNNILLLKATYGEFGWGLPGGALDQQETIHEALIRECKEELGCQVQIEYLSGLYYHHQYNSQAFIFRCQLQNTDQIRLSDEHSEFAYFDFEGLSSVQRKRVDDCLNYNGVVVSAKF